MMKLRIQETAVCRTAAFPLGASLEEVWEDLKISIRESSPEFYAVIKTYQKDELKLLDKKIRFTLWKYLNRATYRATPFGSFSAISLVPVRIEKACTIELKSALVRHHWRDWREAEELIPDKNSLFSASTLFYKNSSAYLVANEIRYLRSIHGKFEITTLVSSPELKKILEICHTYQPLEEIILQMECTFHWDTETTLDFIRQLLSLQLLITNEFPNITGPDYFERMGSSVFPGDSSYLIAEREYSKGQLSYQELADIPGLIHLMAQYLPMPEQTDLAQFKRDFLKRFEYREIPLSLAMDPETGVGYGSFEQFSSHPLIRALKRKEKNKNEFGEVTYSSFHAFLLDQLMLPGPLQLADFKQEKSGSANILPNTWSVLLHFWDDVPVIEQMGGVTATALLGRFTPVSGAFETLAHELVAIEEKANPAILFFDIAYQAEKTVDNINRRKQIYKEELPILTWSVSESPIDFDDILVSVRADRVFLRSKKRGKRLIPRIASAYNYNRSDLAVYRFLCDIQHQDVQTDLTLHLSHAFPSLQKYPRVLYRQLIVAPAMWRVPSEFLEKKPMEHAHKMTALQNWLKKEGIRDLFKAGSGDKTLHFDPHSVESLTAFLRYCLQQSDPVFYISEALIGRNGKVKDEKNRPYSAQFILNYSHEQKIHEPMTTTRELSPLAFSSERIQLPGSHWLYYRLTVFPGRSDRFLVKQIADFIKKVKPYIRQWFFVRYPIPSPHLRLRLHLKEPALLPVIHCRLTEIIAPAMQSGQISQFSIDTYERELERYGVDRMHLVEGFFHTDSEYALWLIKKVHRPEQLYASTLHTLANCFLPPLGSLEEKINFVKETASQFYEEMCLDSTHFKELNKSFNELNERLSEWRINLPSSRQQRYSRSLAKVLDKLSGSQKRNVLADLIHMHINRLFVSDQRLHETVIYHFLFRHLMALRGRSN